MNLTANFTLEELVNSSYATAHGLDNTPTPAIAKELERTAQLLQRVRNYLTATTGKDFPLTVTSGYRSPAVNKGTGSSDGSDHLKGMAADFKARYMTPYQVCQALIPKLNEFGIGQLINEQTWVHISTNPTSRAVNRILTIDRLGTRVGILEVR